MDLAKSIMTTAARLGALCESAQTSGSSIKVNTNRATSFTLSSNCNCALGAVTARPSSLINDKAAMCLSKTSRERYFVSASAGFASPCTLNNRKSPPQETHSCPTARRLTRPIPALLQIPTAAAESVCILRIVLKPESRQHSGSQALPWCP